MNEKPTTRVKIAELHRTFIFPTPGCPGCQHPTIGRIISEVLEELDLDGKAIAVYGIGCHGNIGTINVDGIEGTHGSSPDVATAIRRLRPDSFVFTVQGDGDCLAIGAGSFLTALARGEMITIILCNNANYGMTGGQLAPTTPIGVETTTTPDGRSIAAEGYPIRAAELAAAFEGVAYSARGALTGPKDYQRTKTYVRKAFQKQIDRVGLSFVEVLSACPPNWHCRPVESLRWIEEKMIPIFPLGEFKDADRLG
jgi:2-oxoglutarate ferredoxin oxidoreductase subunit beta